MTFQFLDAQRARCLSTDTKPTTVETNFIAIEENTGDEYIFNGSAWSKL
jgi:hypothetical protein|tara:strand:+ start:615 stop:761 length:147 start_codon:yes stop_codon:yes gene_type:complete